MLADCCWPCCCCCCCCYLYGTSRQAGRQRGKRQLGSGQREVACSMCELVKRDTFISLRLNRKIIINIIASRRRRCRRRCLLLSAILPGFVSPPRLCLAHVQKKQKKEENVYKSFDLSKIDILLAGSNCCGGRNVCLIPCIAHS